MEISLRVDLDAAKLVLAELQRQHDVHLADFDVLNTKAISLLEWSSLAMAVVSAISISDLAAAGQWSRTVGNIVLPEQITPVIVLLLTFGLYLAMVVKCLRTIRPGDYELPIGSDWDELCDAYLVPGEQDAVEQLLSQYLGINERNEARVSDMAGRVKGAALLFPFVIFSLVVLVSHPLWQGMLP